MKYGTASEDQRRATRCGPAGWPYVRKLGGVSLFDFTEFDVDAYQARYPASTWREFVPFRRDWGASVWIEIDRGKAAKALIGGEDLLARQHKEKMLRYRLMPYIEACHRGDVASDFFVRALVVGNGDAAFRSIAM